MTDEPNNPAVPADESASEPFVPPRRWRTRIQASSKWARKHLLALIAIAISATSAYFAYQSKSIGLKHLDIQSRNDRPAIAIINAGVEGLDQEKINLSLQFKNVATRTAYSLAIIVVGFDPKTEKGRQLAHIAGTNPMRHDISFTANAPIKRSEMLSVVVLCLLYADEDKQGFTEHLYYDAPDASKTTGRVELNTLAPELYKRVDDLRLCRMQPSN
jgi:hypothetical protein